MFMILVIYGLLKVCYFVREKSQLHHTTERLTSELQEMKDKCEELRESRQESVRELLNLQDQHAEEIRLMKSDLQDETNTREGMDRRINDLRAEVHILIYL